MQKIICVCFNFSSLHQIHDDLEKEDYSGSGFGPDDEDSTSHHRGKQPVFTTNSGNNKQQPNRKDQKIDTDLELGSGHKNINEDHEDDDDEEDDADEDDTEHEHNVFRTNINNSENKQTDSKATDIDNEDVDENDEDDDDLTTEIDKKHEIDPTTTDDEDLERQCMVLFFSIFINLFILLVYFIILSFARFSFLSFCRNKTSFLNEQ